MREEVLRLATKLCAIPGVTVPAADTDFEALQRTVKVAKEYALGKGLRVYELQAGEGAPYPYLVVTFSENDLEDESFAEAVALIGHLDVVPASAEGQFSPVGWAPFSSGRERNRHSSCCSPAARRMAANNRTTPIRFCAGWMRKWV